MLNPETQPLEIHKSSNKINVALVRPLINERLNSPFFLPLGLLCIASGIQECGHRVKVFDHEYDFRKKKFQIEGDYIFNMCDPIINYRPHVVGISVISDTIPLSILVARRLKECIQGVVVVLGGSGVYGMMPKLMDRFPECFDYVCEGEGEATFIDLINNFANTGKCKSVPGGWVRKQNMVVKCKERKLLDMNTLLEPAYDLVNMNDYLQLSSPRVFDLHVGSGCTYACKFCTTAPFWGGAFRAKSPDKVLYELEFLHVKYGITKVNFLHDNFANNKKYLNEFLDYFILNNNKFKWGCAVRPDNMSHEILKKMKAAGCVSVFCGTDSGSSKILKMMTKMSSNDKSYVFFKYCKELDLSFETNTIIGYPEESAEDLEKSLEIIFDATSYGSCNSDVSILQPLPGADITITHSNDIEIVKTPQYGNFFPIEVQKIVENNIDLFPGNGFIRKNNFTYEFYNKLLPTIKYFNRHYFRTIFIMKYVGFKYLEILSAISNTPLDEYSIAFNLYVNNASFISPLDGKISKAVLMYDNAIEFLRKTEVANEIENIYNPAHHKMQDKKYVMLELDVAIDEVLKNFPNLKISHSLVKRSIYLVHIKNNSDIVTIKLNEWQEDLFRSMIGEKLDNDCHQRIIKKLTLITGKNHKMVSKIVSEFSQSMRDIIN